MTRLEFPLLETARKHAGECAYRDGSFQATYSELAADMESRREQLEHHGLLAGQRIAWRPRCDYETLVNLWAILHTGAIACPISHRLPAGKQQEIITRLRATPIDELTPNDTDSKEAIDTRFHDAQAPATIILSSGSTGVPKAVVHSLQAHISSAAGAMTRIQLGPGDGWLWALPAFHVGGLSIPFRCAVAGATVCGVDAKQAAIADWIRALRPTHVSLVPAQLRRLLENNIDLAFLKTALVGGMSVPGSLIEEAAKRGLAVHTTYGLSEMASQVTTSAANPSEGTSGHVLPGREFTIRADGEILVRGETLCLGYAVDNKIVPSTDEDGWFHTRDLGQLNSSGELEVLGRLDHMFVSGGENIYPESIERELLAIKGIRQAIVVPRTNAEFGHRPVAFVEADALRADAWNTSLRERLAGFEIPTAYLPWPNETGLGIKPDRKKLQDLANT